MEHLSSQAIVLHTRDYAEWDSMCSLFTEDFGRITGIAKGAKRSRKRFGSALEPFTHVQAFFVDKENRSLCLLERCQILTSFEDMAHDIKKVVFGNYFLELVNLLTPERERHPDVFSLLLFFGELLKGSSFREGLMRIFEFRLFSLLGYQPQFQGCVACGKKFQLQETYKFSVNRGGIVCSVCQDRHGGLLPLSNGTIRIFQQVRHLHLAKLNRIYFSPAEQDEGRRIFEKFLEYHIGKRPRSLGIIEQLEKSAP